MTTETNETASAATETESKTETKTAGAAKFTFEELERFREEAVTDNIKLREKNAEYKKQLQQLESQARKGVELEEQLTKAEQNARERVAKTEFRARLRAEGIDNPNALKLLDLETIKYDDEGDVANADEVWAQFQEANPFLFNGKSAKATDTSTTSIQKAPSPKITEVDWATVSHEEMRRVKPSRL